jgi:CubicO group peptidase (beta-lactamase class C family)
VKAIDDLLRKNLGKVYTAAAVELRQRGAVLYREVFGSVDPDGTLDGPPVTRSTRFDFASLTKLYTTSAFFRLVDAGRVTLDTPVGTILPGFNGPRPIRPYEDPLNLGQEIAVVPPTDEQIDASAVTFKHLLTHSSGLPAWINLRSGDNEAARLEMCLTTPFAYPIGSRVVYSDVGYILLGAAIERLSDRPLDSAMKLLVVKPLDLSIRYGPIDTDSVAPTEFCAWRQRRIVGEVHDENAATLSGVAGHAGLFGTASDVATLAQAYLSGGSGIISQRLARESTREQIHDPKDPSIRRGLGWQMKATEAPTCGPYFSTDSFGHTGFVGNSVWVDPPRELVAVLLTNNVYFGRDKTQITRFRPLFHDMVVETLK